MDPHFHLLGAYLMTCNSTLDDNLAKDRVSITFAALSSIIRIAHKYQVDDATERAARRLAQFFSPGDAWFSGRPMKWMERWLRIFSLSVA